MSTRGLVVSPPLEISGSIYKLRSSDLDPQELRSNLLFWDVLDFPTNNIVHLELSSDAQFLEEAGILQRSKINVSQPGDLAQLTLAAHIEAFQTLDKAEPGKWSLATGERSISFPNDLLLQKRGALVSLHNAVPVPDKDVPLPDLLEFKRKRRDELLATRHHLEEIYQKIVSAGDGPLALQSQIEQLQLALKDQLNISREAPFSFRLSNMNASLNLLPVAVAAVTAHIFGLPMLPTIISSLPASLSLNMGVALKNRKPSSTPYKYVTSYHKELF